MMNMLNEKTIANRVLIGRTSTGSRIYATVQLRTQDRDAVTVDHEPIAAGYKSLSFTWDEKEADGREGSGGAGTSWSVEAVVRPSKVLTMAEVRRLAEIAKEWHLSDMNAGCSHMTLPTDPSYDARKNITCPTTDYKYGSAWLVKVVPDELIAELHEMFGVPMGV